ncbi:hypothetical protein SAMN05428974_0601 [Sphingopyxis sp. YR583]|uniref:AAA family ATPase n=1 Tax=Sphingopyxis sp. YR583 TaxID=1881047 RepID=UPI0008A76AFB|nr:ATP-binding protein [Sphingopyxis sp. YR583]SEH12929.1 hypothetical protein SAMN05428974_0601 [Sphingopyxis sp. YR583]
MLHALTIENFYSVLDEQVVDLRVADNAPEMPHRFAPLWMGSDTRAPKVIAVFGANASGKSTILRALSFIAWFLRDSFGIAPDGGLPFERFNSNDGRARSTRLSVSLGGLVDPEDDRPDAPECLYHYELELGGPIRTTVEREALYYWPPPFHRKVRLFERDMEGKVIGGTGFPLSGFSQALGKILRPNASVISTLAQLKHPFATAIWEMAQRVYSNILIERADGLEDQVVRLYASDPMLMASLNREIERIDLGISGIRVDQGPNGPLMLFAHHGHDGLMPLMLESQGTRMFLRLYPALLKALDVGGIAILDELDTAIHPLILPEILRWFQDPARNPHNAQLWMTCHNASLLEELEKEEIFFTEKDATGRTEIFALSDIKAVRREDNHYRKYLAGAYGAVPSIG